MTAIPAPSTSAPAVESAALDRDHRGSWIPNLAMIATRFMELRKRRGLMIALIAVFIGIPTLFLVIRLLAHAFAPHTYGPAGGYEIFTSLIAGVIYIFGFIVAATLGCTAGSVDLTDGMFRHLVITGRSRLALYFARIPAGLAILVPLVAVGFTIVCAVCVFAAPTKLSFQGVNVPAGLSKSGLEAWAAANADEVVCDFPFNGPVNAAAANCGPGPAGAGGVIVKSPGGATTPPPSTPAELRAAAKAIAAQNYVAYSQTFLSPSISLMVESGLWIELEAIIGFIVGLGLASLMGQRTVPVILLIVLQIVLTPIFSRTAIAHVINLQRGLVGLATSHLEPSGLAPIFAGQHNGGTAPLVPESTFVAVCVVVGWVVVWTALGAWRMNKRDV